MFQGIYPIYKFYYNYYYNSLYKIADQIPTYPGSTKEISYQYHKFELVTDAYAKTKMTVNFNLPSDKTFTQQEVINFYRKELLQDSWEEMGGDSYSGQFNFGKGKHFLHFVIDHLEINNTSSYKVEITRL